MRSPQFCGGVIHTHPQGYSCGAFPSPEVPLHRLLVGLIMAATALPVKLIIERVFELSNDPAGLQNQFLKNVGISKIFGRVRLRPCCE